MKTIAVSIDEGTLQQIDQIAQAVRANLSEGKAQKPGRPARGGRRSQVIRSALQEYVARHEKQQREDEERQALARHRALLDRQLHALVAEQAKP